MKHGLASWNSAGSLGNLGSSSMPAAWTSLAVGVVVTPARSIRLSASALPASKSYMSREASVSLEARVDKLELERERRRPSKRKRHIILYCIEPHTPQDCEECRRLYPAAQECDYVPNPDVRPVVIQHTKAWRPAAERKYDDALPWPEEA